MKGGINKFYDVDGKEVDKDDLRAVTAHFSSRDNYECVAQCNDENCICVCDDAAEKDTKVELLRKALNRAWRLDILKKLKELELLRKASENLYR